MIFGEVTDFLEKIKFGDLKDEGYLKVTTPEMDFVIEAVSNENYVVPSAEVVEVSRGGERGSHCEAVVL